MTQKWLASRHILIRSESYLQRPLSSSRRSHTKYNELRTGWSRSLQACKPPSPQLFDDPPESSSRWGASGDDPAEVDAGDPSRHEIDLSTDCAGHGHVALSDSRQQEAALVGRSITETQVCDLLPKGRCKQREKQQSSNMRC